MWATRSAADAWCFSCDRVEAGTVARIERPRHAGLIARTAPRALFLAEGRGLRQLLAGCRHIGALAGEEILDCTPQRRIEDVVRGIGGGRQIAARNLVLALG